MIRTQIQLEERQAKALKKLALERDVSVAELIRRAIDESLLQGDDAEARYRRALTAIGKGRSGRTDIGEKHDDYFVEAVHDW